MRFDGCVIRESLFAEMGSLLGTGTFSVHGDREIESMGAESLGNSSEFGTETDRKRRGSCSFPGISESAPETGSRWTRSSATQSAYP